VVGIFYNKFLAICFDEEFARLRGLKTHWLYLLLLCLTALTIVLLVRIVGIIMVIALLTLPAAIAGNFARSIRQMMLIACLICAACIVSGLGISYSLDLPSGSVIILLATSAYLLSLWKWKRKN
jgi:zinc transport system permease protein